MYPGPVVGTTADRASQYCQGDPGNDRAQGGPTHPGPGRSPRSPVDGIHGKWANVGRGGCYQLGPQLAEQVTLRLAAVLAGAGGALGSAVQLDLTPQLGRNVISVK